MKRLSLLLAGVFFLALLFFLLRGPYLSNSIKRVILPVLENAIGERIIIDKAVINLFPFYLQTKGFKVFDEKGNRLLRVTKMRAYIDLFGLFSKEIRIRRWTVHEPNITADGMKLENVLSSIQKKSSGEDGKNYRVTVKSAKITDGDFHVYDNVERTAVSGSGLYMDVVSKDDINIGISLKEGSLQLPGLPEMKGGLDGRVRVIDKTIKIHDVKLYSSGSTLEARGAVSPKSSERGLQGEFSGKAKILVGTLGDIFGLKQKREGELTISGAVDLVSAGAVRRGLKHPKVKLDLKTNGWFYLETLMELLKVDEQVSGRITLNGEIQGTFPDLIGEGRVKLKDAVLDTLPLEKGEGQISYKDKKLYLNDFLAHTYEGELKGNAFLIVPEGRYFVNARVIDVDSLQFFKFIRWEPPFPAGKVNGTFQLDKSPGKAIELFADARYSNTTRNIGDIKDRLLSIGTEIALKEDIITLSNAVLSTSLSELYLNGNIDLKGEQLELDVEMKSSDALDLTAPYYDGLRASLKFKGKATGSSLAPEVSGTIEVDQGTIQGEPFDEAIGTLTYNPDLLTVTSLRISQGESIYQSSGSISFRQSKGLFSFVDPYFRAEATIEKGDARSLLNAAYKRTPVSGSVGGKITFMGDTRKFKGTGDISLRKGDVFGQSIDHAVIKAELLPEVIHFPTIEVNRETSRLNAKGSVYFDERFNVEILSDNLKLSDATVLDLDQYSFDADIRLDVQGSGTLKDPNIQFTVNVLRSFLKKTLVGKGDVRGELKDRKLSVEGDLLGGIAKVNARAILSKSLPWSIDLEFRKGRYDFILASFLEEVPRDISASLEGKVNLKGRRKKFSMNTKLSSLNFSLYGYTFKNKEDIVLELENSLFNIRSFSIRGTHGDITATGTANIGKDLNVNMEGNINLTPLRAVISEIESLKGLGSFSVTISGSWESPELQGKVHIEDGMVMMVDFPYLVGPISGDVFFDRERVTFETFDAEFAGGKVSLSGVGYMQKLTMKRLALSSELKGIKLRSDEGVNAVFDGELFFEASPNKQSLLGDIHIRKAKYAKRVEWKSGLLNIQQERATPLKKPSFLDETELNIYVTGKEHILIDNNIARTPVNIDLNILGTFAQYGLLGSIESQRGTIFFRGNEFEILEGRVDFVETNRIVPVYHIQSETFVKGYRVRLNLDGPVDKFTLAFFSDPPLADDEILTLLTAGHIEEGSEGIDSGIGAGEATAFLTGRFQDVLEERFKFITGFERFEVDPHTTVTGALSSKITVGKRMLDDQLLVTYSSSIGSTELDVIKLQYNLTKNFSLIGSRDEIGSVGGDIRYRFEFK
jgi:autotransporter translocation and assembly factor TamB